MCRYILGTTLLLLSLNVSAQVTSPLLNCAPIQGNVAFTAKFNGQNATVVFKGWTYNLKYTRAWVSPQGERWSYYENQEISVGTTFPLDKFVHIMTEGLSSPKPIASAYCN